MGGIINRWSQWLHVAQSLRYIHQHNFISLDGKELPIQSKVCFCVAFKSSNCSIALTPCQHHDATTPDCFVQRPEAISQVNGGSTQFLLAYIVQLNYFLSTARQSCSIHPALIHFVLQRKHMELVLDKSMQHFDFSDYSRLSDEVKPQNLPSTQMLFALTHPLDPTQNLFCCVASLSLSKSVCRVTSLSSLFVRPFPPC